MCVEPKLLTLWQHTRTGKVKISELADLLSLSTKQTTRYLHKWHEEGWLHYKGGTGRGRYSEITWLKDVEAVYEKRVHEVMKDGKIEECARHLLLDWSRDCKLRLVSDFQSRLGYEKDGEDRLIIPRKRPFITTHPLKARDVHSANLVANVYDRLVSVDEHSSVHPALAHSWELNDARLRLYLRKGVKFHDGSPMSPEDVCDCLRKMSQHPFYERMWAPVSAIKARSPYVIDLEFRYPCHYALHLLGIMAASIYKEAGGSLYGTGSFSIVRNDDTKTLLHAFQEYYKERAFLDEIEYVQVPRDFENLYRSSAQSENYETYKVDSDFGFGLIIMNSYRDSDIARDDVRDFLHFQVTKLRQQLREIDARLIPNEQGFLAGISQPYELGEINCPVLRKPLVIQMSEYSRQTAERFREILVRAGCPVELVQVPFADTLDNGINDYGCDIFFHGEVFEMDQKFSFFQFLFGGTSPLQSVLDDCVDMEAWLKRYAMTAVSEWMPLHIEMERFLIETSRAVPLYYSKRSFLFTDDLMDVETRYFGHADFSKLWMKPSF